MTNLSRSLLATLSLSLLCSSVLADGMADSKPVKEMECLLGTWKATGTMTLGKDTLPITATWTCKPTAAKVGVLCNLSLKGIPGLASYEETDLMGWEPNTGMYHWFSVTNAGETHDHVAKPPTSNTIHFEYVGTQEGKPLKEVIDMTFGPGAKPTTFTLKSETFVAGSSTAVMQVTAKK